MSPLSGPAFLESLPLTFEGEPADEVERDRPKIEGGIAPGLLQVKLYKTVDFYLPFA